MLFKVYVDVSLVYIIIIISSSSSSSNIIVCIVNVIVIVIIIVIIIIIIIISIIIIIISCYYMDQIRPSFKLRISKFGVWAKQILKRRRWAFLARRLIY